MNHYDDIIENGLFQAVPASSFRELSFNMSKAGFPLAETALRDILAHLRRNAAQYGWTIPHVGSLRYYYPVLCDKDGNYHADPMAKASLFDGSLSISKRIITETSNHAVMFRAVAGATYISRPHRARLIDLAEDYEDLGKRTKRILRHIQEEINGTAANGS